ncbi:MAG: hypothetical protein ACP5N7_00110 [Candidatus Pacearchaeota archaeon]
MVKKNEKEQWYVVARCGQAIKFRSNEELFKSIKQYKHLALGIMDLPIGLNITLTVDDSVNPAEILRWAMDNKLIKTYGVWR